MKKCPCKNVFRCFRRQPPLQRIRRQQAGQIGTAERHQHPEQRPPAQIGSVQAVAVRPAPGGGQGRGVLRLQRRGRPVRHRGRQALQDPEDLCQEHLQLPPLRDPGDDS